MSLKCYLTNQPTGHISLECMEQHWKLTGETLCQWLLWKVFWKVLFRKATYCSAKVLFFFKGYQISSLTVLSLMKTELVLFGLCIHPSPAALTDSLRRTIMLQVENKIDIKSPRVIEFVLRICPRHMVPPKK